MKIETAKKLLLHIADYTVDLRKNPDYGYNASPWFVSEKNKDKPIYDANSIKEIKNEDVTGYTALIKKEVYDSFFKNLLIILFTTFNTKFIIDEFQVINLNVIIKSKYPDSLTEYSKFLKNIPHVVVNYNIMRDPKTLIVEIGKI